jgi:hypothetical protein
MAAENLYLQRQPQPPEMSDEELEAAAARLIQRRPLIAVRAAVSLGWRLIPPEDAKTRDGT